MAEGSPSKIPTPLSSLRRSTSLRVKGERPIIVYSSSPTPFPSIIEKEESCSLSRGYWPPTRRNLSLRSQSQASGLNKEDNDSESVVSFSSNASKPSLLSNCEHSLFAKNGTTFSARSNKYVVHCSGHCNTAEEYLTPTQRANRNVRRLKTLLQLAKEKLVEKEKEIFNLTKEVVELKIFKASIKNSFSEASTPSDCKESAICGPATYTVDEVREFPCDSHGNTSCCCFDDKLEDEVVHFSPEEKLSPTSPFHNYQRDNLTATPDYILSSLADSGHFDDIASTISIQSKDSFNIQVQTDTVVKLGEESEERARLVSMYEDLLSIQKNSHEDELRSLKLVHEETSLRMIDSFELKLKNEEREFENKFQALLAATESEKIEIVNKFEKRLEEERLIYLEKLKGGKVDTYNSDMCVQTESLNNFISQVDIEKQNYEMSLTEIKEKFESERTRIEKNFDSVMSNERVKFENTVTKIEADYEFKIKALSEKITSSETIYTNLLQKYEDSLNKIAALEEENCKLRSNLSEQNSLQKEMYLKMFVKGQEAVKLQYDDAPEDSASAKAGAPTPELLVQLKVTEIELENLKDKEYREQHSGGHGVSLISAKEALSLWMLAARKAMYKRLSEAQQRPQETYKADFKNIQPGQDPEATLQFLKSAVYYFLTDRDNHLQHLRAIENILGFSHSERKDISTHYVHY